MYNFWGGCLPKNCFTTNKLSKRKKNCIQIQKKFKMLILYVGVLSTLNYSGICAIVKKIYLNKNNCAVL